MPTDETPPPSENQMTADSTTAGATVRLGHVALAAARPDRLESFYRELIGPQLVRRAGNALTGPAVLFSGRPAEEDHELVLLGNPHAAHVAFRVATSTALAEFYGRAIVAAVPMPVPPAGLRDGSQRLHHRSAGPPLRGLLGHWQPVLRHPAAA
jgi:catechol 2,3-dioxygenase-like lactoylglutathione lyase family enzyme